jgi:hypothetical protein
MSIRLRPVLLILLLFGIQKAYTQSSDVNAERVSIDAQILRSIDGSASLMESSVFPQSLINLTPLADDSSDAFGRYVRSYYDGLMPGAPATEGMLAGEVLDGRWRGLVQVDDVLRFQADASLMLRGGTTTNDQNTKPFLLVRPSVRFMGSMGGGLGYFLDLSNGRRMLGAARRIARTDPTLARTTKFISEDTSFFDRYVGYVQYQTSWMRIRFGREAMQWGASPIDNFVHSLEAPLLDGLLIDVPYKRFRYTMTHSGANSLDTSGSSVPGKFIATHRIAFEPTNWLNIAVNDMIVYWGRGLDMAYLNPLAFFVSAGLSTRERNLNDNSMLSFDVAVRPMQGMRAYTSIVIDDVGFATLGDTSRRGNNNKFAYQVGLSQAFGTPGASSRSMLTLEYARIDPFTFTHRSINASYSTFGASVGYDMQPNSDRVALQARHWFTPRTSLRVDLDYTRHGENLLDANGNILTAEDPDWPGSGALVAIGNVGGDILRGDGDFIVGNRFLRGNLSHQRRARLWFSAEWMPNFFTDVRVGYTNRNGGNNPESFLFGSIEMRIGY